jgi:hypothetical protein
MPIPLHFETIETGKIIPRHNPETKQRHHLSASRGHGETNVIA